MRHFGIIGYPLEHSFSARYFTEKFLREEVDADYKLFSIPTTDFPIEKHNQASTLVRLLATMDGVNITYPYKQSIIPFLRGLDPTAEKIGAVNVVYKGIGYNTDCIGFMHSLHPLLRSTDHRALVLGTGGAAKAIAYGLQQMSIIPTIVSRKAQKGCITYEQIDRHTLSTHSLIIQCTPLGMYPDIDSCPPIPYDELHEHHLLYDCIYNPQETKFLHYGRQHGTRTINGLNMLYGQAEAAWKIWNNHL